MITANNNSTKCSTEEALAELAGSMNPYQLTVIGGRPESDGELFFHELVRSANHLVFNFETGNLSLTNPEEVLGQLESEVSAMDVLKIYEDLRSSLPIDGLGLFRVQCMFPINKDRETFTWNQYQRPIELVTLARKTPLPITAFSALNQIGKRCPNKNDLRAEFRMLAPFADRICLIHGSGSDAEAHIYSQEVTTLGLFLPTDESL